ncbi:MAG TPA: MFS transporter [Chloroflexota bacterium]|jgi:MFS family permease|nr:MFS transporter [Chloroflexota bacterium]
MRLPSGDPERSGYRWSLAGTIIGSFLVRIAGAATGVLLGLLLSSMHRSGVAGSSAVVVGVLMAAFNFSELVGALVAGVLIDRRGLRPLLLAGPLLGLAATILFAIPTRSLGLTCGRLLQGLTTACTVPAALAFLSGATTEGSAGRGRIMGFFEAGSIGGLAVGYALGGILWDRFRRQAFWGLLIIYAIAVTLFLFVRTPRGMVSQRPPRATWTALRQTGDLMPSWLALNAAAGLWFGQAAFQLSGANPRPSQLLTTGLSGSTIGMIFAVYTVLFAVGTISWGWLIGRASVATAMRVGVGGALMTSVAILGINHATSFGGLWFYIPLGIGIAAVAAETAFAPAALTLLAARSDSVPEGRGAVMGVYSMLLGAGQLVGAMLGGLVAMPLGVDGLVLTTAILAVIGLISLPANMETRPRPSPEWQVS